jgi:phosphoglycolate phosphatase
VRQPILICDLDGTLVDSHQGVAEAIRRTCCAVGIEPREPLDESLVGPPLDEVLRRVTGLCAANAIDRLRNIFIEAYDNVAVQLTVPFEGAEEMLRSVRARGYGLALATNKRHKPTVLILEALGWKNLFEIIEAVDSRTESPRPKSGMLRDIVAISSPPSAAYLGDTVADGTAAREASMPFLLAGWGYGGHNHEPTTTIVHRPDEVPDAFIAAINLGRPRSSPRSNPQ